MSSHEKALEMHERRASESQEKWRTLKQEMSRTKEERDHVEKERRRSEEERVALLKENERMEQEILTTRERLIATTEMLSKHE